jgi:prepilin-type N-terminal cleavage/methylation domain-containing protein/prepilin-type processing-associated H-X9-DG protein
MKKIRKRTAFGFTLVELLVVISVIALLLAILMPALGKARELANRIVCGQHLKTLTQASTTYASTYSGFYVPCGYWGLVEDSSSGNIKEDSVTWLNNRAFLAYVAKKDLTQVGAGELTTGLNLPKEFLCPNDQITKDTENKGTGNVSTSYGYNMTDWNVPGAWGDAFEPDSRWRGHVGHSTETIKSPADKLHFTETIDWWCNWDMADYRDRWDVYRQEHDVNWWVNKSPFKSGGAVMYRHAEGANVGFYDGHLEYLKKEKIFIVDDYNKSPKWAGMWTATGLVN